MNTPRTLGSQNKPLGDRGERLAAEHLERAGWTVLARLLGFTTTDHHT